MLSAPMLKNLKREKPWAKLRMSRKEYETRRPCTNAGVRRTGFEEHIAHFPDAVIDSRQEAGEICVNPSCAPCS